MGSCIITCSPSPDLNEWQTHHTPEPNCVTIRPFGVTTGMNLDGVCQISNQRLPAPAPPSFRFTRVQSCCTCYNSCYILPHLHTNRYTFVTFVTVSRYSTTCTRTLMYTDVHICSSNCPQKNREAQRGTVESPPKFKSAAAAPLHGPRALWCHRRTPAYQLRGVRHSFLPCTGKPRLPHIDVRVIGIRIQIIDDSTKANKRKKPEHLQKAHT